MSPEPEAAGQRFKTLLHPVDVPGLARETDSDRAQQRPTTADSVEDNEEQTSLGDEDSQDDSLDSTEAPQRRGATFTFLNQQATISTPASPALIRATGNLSAQNQTPDVNGRRRDAASTSTHAKRRRPGTFSMRDMLRPVGPISKDFLPEPTLPQGSTRRGGVCEDDPISMGFVSERIARLLFE